MIIDTDHCWHYAGYINSNGYGKILANSKAHYAHRVVYENERGPIPSGLQIDHLCRVRSCINPKHLEVVTRRENILRGTNPAALAHKRTHCSKGHEYTPENTRIYRGYRRCRPCDRIYHGYSA